MIKTLVTLFFALQLDIPAVSMAQSMPVNPALTPMQEPSELGELKKNPKKSLGAIKYGLAYNGILPMGVNPLVYITLSTTGERLTIQGSQSIFKGKDSVDLVLASSKDAPSAQKIKLDKKDKDMILHPDGTFIMYAKSKHPTIEFHLSLPDSNWESVGFFQMAPMLSH